MQLAPTEWIWSRGQAQRNFLLAPTVVPIAFFVSLCLRGKSPFVAKVPSWQNALRGEKKRASFEALNFI
jgi:hypothetical protein